MRLLWLRLARWLYLRHVIQILGLRLCVLRSAGRWSGVNVWALVFRWVLPRVIASVECDVVVLVLVLVVSHLLWVILLSISLLVVALVVLAVLLIVLILLVIASRVMVLRWLGLGLWIDLEHLPHIPVMCRVLLTVLLWALVQLLSIVSSLCILLVSAVLLVLRGLRSILVEVDGHVLAQHSCVCRLLLLL